MLSVNNCVVVVVYFAEVEESISHAGPEQHREDSKAAVPEGPRSCAQHIVQKTPWKKLQWHLSAGVTFAVGGAQKGEHFP